MASASNGDLEPEIPRRSEAPLYVGHTATPHDRRRPAVDEAVPDASRTVVFGISSAPQRPGERARQSGEGGVEWLGSRTSDPSVSVLDGDEPAGRRPAV